ncbi:MAG TPA: hypothetical protein VFC25_06265 [Verrucomicrobiae bacterium]|nr:hypothetical protein [Verrucomicrobiae bacterium]
MKGPIIQATKLQSAVTPTAGAAGATNINGSIIDMAGFDACLIAVHFGAIVAGALTSIKAQQGDDSGLSDAADVAGSSVTVADTDDDKVFYIDVRPRKRYLRLVVSRATQNATVCASYLQYDAHDEPSAQLAAVTGATVTA